MIVSLGETLVGRGAASIPLAGHAARRAGDRCYRPLGDIERNVSAGAVALSAEQHGVPHARQLVTTRANSWLVLLSSESWNETMPQLAVIRST